MQSHAAVVGGPMVQGPRPRRSRWKRARRGL